MHHLCNKCNKVRFLMKQQCHTKKGFCLHKTTILFELDYWSRMLLHLDPSRRNWIPYYKVKKCKRCFTFFWWIWDTSVNLRRAEQCELLFSNFEGILRIEINNQCNRSKYSDHSAWLCLNSIIQSKQSHPMHSTCKQFDKIYLEKYKCPHRK